ncbi:uncharacterized protein LOC120745984 [Simochromis diagramma]|uniref:uncharacterized protein LOC120745984 n=1 Tax=Simochromis diagramma TaxID=43689 RepID=UPI001A7E1E3B|nr:uncharacterized protein LOC120745984 [Simochromis diagramma]
MATVMQSMTVMTTKSTMAQGCGLDRLLLAQGFHCCNTSLSLSLSLSRSLPASYLTPPSSWFIYPPAPCFIFPSLLYHSLTDATSHHTLALSLSLSLSLSHLPAFSLAPPACRRLPVHLPRQSNNWLLSVLESSRKSGRRRRSRGGKGEEEELFCEASFARPSLAAAAAASVPLPPSAAAQRPPLSLLDAPSPAGICLHLLLRELFLELGGGGRSPPPSLPRTLSKARRIVGELRRGTTLSDRRKQAPLSPSNPSFPGLMGKSWMSTGTKTPHCFGLSGDLGGAAGL